MRLISCYIENFGGLSQRKFNFDEGITVIQEENGFGKTTLAEFIRAMFYGLPRANNKSLEKHKRKKYAPWQGGRYGGNLIFEHEGTQYRIERTFGSTPAGDKFALYDAKTSNPSARFTANIGVELFQLDAESFERSTYFPQVHDASPLATSSIQAKLGDLVDDTKDVNNFEKAIKVLRTKRSDLIPFNGQNGIIANIQRQISEEEIALASMRGLSVSLEQKKNDWMEMDEKLSIKKGAQENIINKIRLASEAAGQKSIKDRLSDMKAEYDKADGKRKELSKCYPFGLPTVEEANQLLQVYDDLTPLNAAPKSESSYADAKKWLQENESRFSKGTPSDKTLTDYQSKAQDLLNKRTTLEGCVLSEGDSDKLQNLQSFFRNEVPEDAFLIECQEKQQRLRDCQVSLNSLIVSEEEQARVKQLENIWDKTAPTDEAITAAQQNLKEIDQLNQENNALASSVVTHVVKEEAPPKKNTRFLPVVLAGALSIIAGIVFLTRQVFAAGGGLLGIGVVLFIIAVSLYLKDMVSREVSASKMNTPQMDEGDKQQMKQNEQRIRELRQEIDNFLSRYKMQGEGPAEKLVTLQSARKEYEDLIAKIQTVSSRRDSIQKEIQNILLWEKEHLTPYFGEEIPQTAHTDLVLKKSEYENLIRKQDENEKRRTSLLSKIKTLEEEIIAFLGKYSDSSSDDFLSQISELHRDCDAYIRNKALVETYEAEAAAQTRAIEDCLEKIRVISEKYDLHLDGQSRRRVMEIRDDVAAFATLTEKLASLEKNIQEFQEKSKGILEAAPIQEQYDLDGLKAASSSLDQEISTLSADLLSLEQSIDSFQRQVDQIPEKEDNLVSLKGQYENGKEKAALLDATINFMKSAKESLSSSYVGSIHQAFASLMSRMMKEDQSDISVNTQLSVQLSRRGAARELEYFSAGQTDMIMLCMRVALVESLFKRSKPFLILDDPFVNLDDANTAEALRLLKDLAQDYQIVYLVCNSSRTP